jgi:hypothetical protein
MFKVDNTNECVLPFFVNENFATAVPCQMQIAFAGHRESDITCWKQSFSLSLLISPPAHLLIAISRTPSLNSIPGLEHE